MPGLRSKNTTLENINHPPLSRLSAGRAAQTIKHMRKKIPLLTLVIITSLLFACGGSGGGKETAVSIAKQWCDLNGKVAKAADDAAKEAAKTAREKFEKEMQEKYKDNQAFLDEVGKEIEKCEDASEGR